MKLRTLKKILKSGRCGVLYYITLSEVYRKYKGKPIQKPIEIGSDSGVYRAEYYRDIVSRNDIWEKMLDLANKLNDSKAAQA